MVLYCSERYGCGFLLLNKVLQGYYSFGISKIRYGWDLIYSNTKISYAWGVILLKMPK